MLRSPRLIGLLGALLLAAQLGLAALWSSGADRAIIGMVAALLVAGALLSIPAVRTLLPRPGWRVTGRRSPPEHRGAQQRGRVRR